MNDGVFKVFFPNSLYVISNKKKTKAKNVRVDHDKAGHLINFSEKRLFFQRLDWLLDNIKKIRMKKTYSDITHQCIRFWKHVYEADFHF